jgi:hypothetical protein
MQSLKHLAVALALGLASTTAAAVQFVVAEWPGKALHNDSFIVTLTNPSHIAHARRLISDGPGIGETILVADIAAGTDGINVDYLAPGKPEWSWHVTSFLGFTDFTAEILDGWPTFVEQDVAGWMLNTNGRIGFWNYTVVAEVPEPATAWLVICGLPGVWLLGRRRRRTPWLEVG